MYIFIHYTFHENGVLLVIIQFGAFIDYIPLFIKYIDIIVVFIYIYIFIYIDYAFHIIPFIENSI